MDLKNLTSYFDTSFRLRCNEISVSRSTIDELMTIWMAMSQEPMELVTCRPVIQRKYEEEKLFLDTLIRRETACFFSIYLKEELVGRITLLEYNMRNRSVEIGYSLLPKFRKNGYMTIALGLLFDYLFLNININKIYAQTGEFNIPSIHLLELLFFSKDAVLREHHELDGYLYDDFIYSLLAFDYYKNK